MAVLFDELWKYNVARVTVVDVTEDYRNLLEPMPSHMYPVLKEMWVPKFALPHKLLQDALVTGYHYDWHETPLEPTEIEHWYVGVVDETF